jgi:hypothetical protein
MPGIGNMEYLVSPAIRIIPRLITFLRRRTPRLEEVKPLRGKIIEPSASALGKGLRKNPSALPKARAQPLGEAPTNPARMANDASPIAAHGDETVRIRIAQPLPAASPLRIRP